MTKTYHDSIELTKELVQIRGPYMDEEEAIAFAHDWLKKEGIPAYYHEYKEEKVTGFAGKNVISVIDSGKPGPVVYLNGHIDTVQLCNGWTKDPYGGEIEDGKLYGVGALDMKSGSAAIMVAIRDFYQNVKNFKGKIITSLVSDEEGPYGLGTSAVIADGITDGIDVAIVTEPSSGFTGASFPNICLGARGAYGLAVEFFGKAAHASAPELGVNAAVDAGKFLANLDQLEFGHHDRLGDGCTCVVKVESDGGACSVPDYAKVSFFWHVVIGENKDTITKSLEDILEKSGIKSEYKIVFREAPSEGTDGLLPYVVEENDPYAKILIKSCEEVTGKEPILNYFGSNGDFNYVGSLTGAPCLIFGPNGKNFHGADEYVEIDTIEGTYKVIYDFLKKVLED